MDNPHRSNLCKCLAQGHNDMLTAAGFEPVLPWSEHQRTSHTIHCATASHINGLCYYYFLMQLVKYKFRMKVVIWTTFFRIPHCQHPVYGVLAAAGWMYANLYFIHRRGAVKMCRISFLHCGPHGDGGGEMPSSLDKLDTSRSLPFLTPGNRA